MTREEMIIRLEKVEEEVTELKSKLISKGDIEYISTVMYQVVDLKEEIEKSNNLLNERYVKAITRMEESLNSENRIEEKMDIVLEKDIEDKQTMLELKKSIEKVLELPSIKQESLWFAIKDTEAYKTSKVVFSRCISIGVIAAGVFVISSLLPSWFSDEAQYWLDNNTLNYTIGNISLSTIMSFGISIYKKNKESKGVK